MNLAVARSIKRSREVGLRKVVGAVRRQLIIQFLGESVLITFVSLLLAVGLTYLLLPFFGQLMERPIEINLLSSPWLLPGLFFLVIMVGLFSGSYPAFIMSSLRPVDVLKAKIPVKLSGFNLQRSLIIFQFAASIILVISSLVIYHQLQFMQQKELGYDKKNIITIRIKDRPLLNKFEQLAGEWKQHSGVNEVTLSSHLPSNVTSSTMINSMPGNNDKTSLAIYQIATEYNYLDVFGIQLVAGRNFSKERNDEKSFLINETAAKAMGWSAEEALGKEFYQDESKTIIGVVKDFHMHSMHLPIQPLMIRLSDRGSYFSLKINHENVPATLAAIEKTFKESSPYPFEYQFMEDNFNQLYQSETKLGEIFGFFTLISMLIASLGLFGLAAFLSAQRTKEIGVRKVLGASVQSIVLLLSKNFLKLVVIVFVVAIPIGWYVMHQWLQDFAYRINLAWWIFGLAGTLAFIIAFISIGYQSIKSASANPVDSLKFE